MGSHCHVRWSNWIRVGVLLLMTTTSLTPQIVSFFLQNELKTGGNPSAVVIGDFNDDGKHDLAVTEERSASVLVLLGLGNGFFQNPLSYKVGLRPRAIAIGDFNRDGRQDLVVANNLSGTISLLLGVRNG